MKNRTDAFIRLFLAFVFGGVLSAYAVVRFSYLPMLEKIQIRNSSMEAYKAVSTLELLRKDRVEAATEFLEWQADEGLMGLHYFTSDARRRKKLDSFAIQALVRAGKYRAEYPRNTKIKHTDNIIKNVITTGVAMSRLDLTPVAQSENTSLPSLH